MHEVMTNRNQLKEAWRGEKTQAKDSGHICSLRKKIKSYCVLSKKDEGASCCVGSELEFYCGKSLTECLMTSREDGAVIYDGEDRRLWTWKARDGQAQEIHRRLKQKDVIAQAIREESKGDRRARELREKQARAKNISRECVQLYTC